MEFSSESCCRVVLFAMGYWRPKLIGVENYKQGQEMGAVSASLAVGSNNTGLLECSVVLALVGVSTEICQRTLRCWTAPVWGAATVRAAVKHSTAAAHCC